MRKLKGQKGLSLVEVTIMLLVLMLLTSVLAPSIWDFVIDAQWVKVKEDCEALGISVARFMRETPPCFSINPNAGVGTRCTRANRADLLFGDGTTGALSALAPNYTGAAGNTAATVDNWDDVLAANADPLEDHLVRNIVGGVNWYPTPGQLGNLSIPGPLYGLGWRGGYLAGPIAPDPWGSRYEINTMFIAAASDPTANNQEGYYGWDRDVFCISPGPNRTFQTPFHGCPPAGDAFGGPWTLGTCRGGDDWTYIIQGSTR